MLRATVPEAPVNEHGDRQRSEHEVGPHDPIVGAQHRIRAHVNAGTLEQPFEPKFRTRSGSSVTTHDTGDGVGAGWRAGRN